MTESRPSPPNSAPSAADRIATAPFDLLAHLQSENRRLRASRSESNRKLKRCREKNRREQGAAARFFERMRAAEQRAIAAEARVAELEREVAYVRGALEEELGRNLVNQIEPLLEAPFTFAQRDPGRWQ